MPRKTMIYSVWIVASYNQGNYWSWDITKKNLENIYRNKY